jgi:ankyrin repeat protein
MLRRRLSLSLPLLVATAALPFAGMPSARATPAAEAGLRLIDAAARGDTDAVRRLLDAGAPIAARDDRGRNAVLAATQGGHVAAARLLIERGADVNAQDDIADSAFLLAGARGRVEIVRAALPHADPRVLNRYGGTALIPACHYGHVETVRLLLAWGGPNRIDVDHVNRLGWTALLEAVMLGDGGARHAEIVRLLLQHGADPNRADGTGITPLAHARQRGQEAVAALIAAAGGR